MSKMMFFFVSTLKQGMIPCLDRKGLLWRPDRTGEDPPGFPVGPWWEFSSSHVVISSDLMCDLMWFNVVWRSQKMMITDHRSKTRWTLTKSPDRYIIELIEPCFTANCWISGGKKTTLRRIAGICTSSFCWGLNEAECICQSWGESVTKNKLISVIVSA